MTRTQATLAATCVLSGMIGLWFFFRRIHMADRIDIARIDAAFIGVIGTVIAAGGALLLWQFQHQSDVTKAINQDKRRQLRMLLALRAELILNLEAQTGQFVGSAAETLRATYLSNIDNAADGEPSMPMTVVSETNDAYEHARPHLSDLPAGILPYVIRYYQLDEYVSQLLKASASGQFESLSIDRRKRVIGSMFDLGTKAAMAAFDAVRHVDDSIRSHDMSKEFSKQEIDLTMDQASAFERISAVLTQEIATAENITRGLDDNDGGTI